jgi:putative endonuclease
LVEKNVDNQRIGQWGEKIAADYLVGKGYRVISRNVYSAAGEIDIVARQAIGEVSCLVFVEVKTRRSKWHGYPEEAFNRAKYNHLTHSIAEFFEANPDFAGDWRIDVIAVIGAPGASSHQIRHFEGIVMPDERE